VNNGANDALGGWTAAGMAHRGNQVGGEGYNVVFGYNIAFADGHVEWHVGDRVGPIRIGPDLPPGYTVGAANHGYIAVEF